MQGSIVRLAASTCLVAVLGAAAPAEAAFATFASGSGNDGNDCLTPTTACREISSALGKTDAFGTIHVLAGTYAPFAIAKSVNIVAESGAATVIGGSEILTIPSGSGANRVLIQGLRFDGFTGPVVSVTIGIAIDLNFEDCTFVYGAGATAYGVDFRPAVDGNSNLFLTRTSSSAPILLPPPT